MTRPASSRITEEDVRAGRARRYFAGPAFVAHCELLGLDPEWVLGMVRTAERETKRRQEAAAAA